MPTREAQKISIGKAVIRIDCDGCFDGSVPVTVQWAPGPGNKVPINITFDVTTFQNVTGVKTTSTLADDVISINQTKIGISGCLTDPCQDGSFLFTAKTTSSIPHLISNPTTIVTVPKLGYAVVGLRDTNGTSEDPNKPFAPISITIKNCGAAAALFAIRVRNHRNCANLVAAPGRVNVPANATSGAITISGDKVDGHTGARFKVTITPPAPLNPCEHSVLVE